MVTLRDLAQLYLLHVRVLEPGASLGFGKGTQNHYCAENLLSNTIQVNLPVKCFSSQLESAFQIICPTYWRSSARAGF